MAKCNCSMCNGFHAGVEAPKLTVPQAIEAAESCMRHERLTGGIVHAGNESFLRSYGRDRAGIEYFYPHKSPTGRKVRVKRSGCFYADVDKCSCNETSHFDGAWIVQLPTLANDCFNGPTFVNVTQHADKQCAFEQTAALTANERVARVIVTRCEAGFTLTKIQDGKRGATLPTFHDSWLVEDIEKYLNQTYPNAYVDLKISEVATNG